MLAIELVKIILGMGAALMSIFAITALFVDKNIMPVNSLLLLVVIALTIMFHI